jgi:Activator of Hsp90 ATPase homolog 1-like protein
MTIEACDPPRHLAVSAQDEHGTWRLEATLAEANGTTEITFVHHLDADAKAADVGPGWEYYLDMLVASRDADPMPDFDASLPAQAADYESQDAARE